MVGRLGASVDERPALSVAISSASPLRLSMSMLLAAVALLGCQAEMEICRSDLATWPGVWATAAGKAGAHAAWNKLVAEPVGTHEYLQLPPSVAGRKALVFAFALPPGALLGGALDVVAEPRTTIGLQLLGNERGQFREMWSWRADRAGVSQPSLTVTVPNDGIWVGGVFSVSGPRAGKAKLTIRELFLEERRPTRARPNIVLLTLDTFRADHLSCMDPSAPPTPNLDSLAKHGALFENAVCTSQCTNPSHVSILTGLYCFAHQVYDNASGVAAEGMTLAEVLKSAGYRTLAATSVGHLNPGTSNLGQGFDVFLPSRWRDPGGEPADVRTTEILRRLETTFFNERPWFMWIHYFDPHTPYAPPSPFPTVHDSSVSLQSIRYRRGMGGVRYDRKTGLVLDPVGEVQRYRGEITFLDQEIGRLLRGLRRLNMLDNSAVAVVGDHGEGLGEHGVYFEHAGMFEDVMRVPVILSGDGIPAGVRAAGRVSTVDVFPTLVELAGVENAPKTYGLSLLPLAHGEARPSHDVIFSESVEQYVCAAWLGKHKLVWCPDSVRKDWTMPERILYFDLDSDPREVDNIYERKTLDVRELQDLWAAAAADPLGHLRPYRGQVQRERLRQLGYVE